MAECVSCGNEIDYRDRLCSNCGAITDRGRSITERLGRSVGGAVDQIARHLGNPENRGQVVILGAIVALMLLVTTDNPLSKALLGPSDQSPDLPQFNADGSPDFESYNDTFLAEEMKFRVTGDANVRNYPTSQSTRVINTLHAGEIVTARQVLPFDAGTVWYRLSGGGYIWGGNVALIEELLPANTPTFPLLFLGRYSSMDTCRGATENSYLIITADELRFSESRARLVRISHDEKGRKLYHLRMSREGQEWNATYIIGFSANGLSMILSDSKNPSRPPIVYYDPNISCDRVY